MMKRNLLLPAALLLLVLAGCGGANISMIQEPTVPLNTYGTLTVSRVDNGTYLDTHPQFMRDDVIASLTKVEQYIKDNVTSFCVEKWTGTGGKQLFIDIVLSDFDPGSKAKRYLAGYGAGTGRIAYVVRIIDGETKGTVAQFEAWGEVKAGAFGGSMSQAYKSVTSTIIGWLKEQL
ncbi:MAG: DUF4410 domain-containing protein [Pseudomonadota bacterium]